jgi:hypothetical protein
MKRALAQDASGNALTAFLPAARFPYVPDDAPMPAALVVVWERAVYPADVIFG